MSNKEKEKITAILIGAGSRGREAYGNWGLKNKDKIDFVAVAEPREARRKAFSREWHIPRDNQFKDWQDLLNDDLGRISDTCLVCTPDQMHTKPALKALKLGYDVLLEKPMAPSLKECKELVKTAEEGGNQLMICHVLRYTEMFSKVKNAIEEGLVGDIINVSHSENVAYWHFGHSYVRGAYKKASESTPVVLAKTCHDLDIIYWLVGSPVKSIHSFGTLSHYRPENAPPGVPKRCTDGCPIHGECPWYAPRLYVNAEPLIRITQRSKKRFIRFMGQLILHHPKFIKILSHLIKPMKTLVNWDKFPATAITDDLSPEGKMEALKEGPYGKCVYHSDNDVPDHQTVNILFENGVTATMTMHGHSYLDGRWFRIDGTRGTLEGKFTYGGEKLVHHDHRYVKEAVLWERDMTFSAHGGGDERLMESFVDSLLTGKQEALTSARASLESHLMGFAAEHSRAKKIVIDLDEMRS